MSADPVAGVEGLLEALGRYQDASVIFTGTNADAFGQRISARIEDFAAKQSGRVHHFASLGQRRYLSALQLADVCIGNSSSGLLEAPSLGTPSVNIGERQLGRLRALSVIDCDEDADAVGAAIEQALSPKFREIASKKTDALWPARSIGANCGNTPIGVLGRPADQGHDACRLRRKRCCRARP